MAHVTPLPQRGEDEVDYARLTRVLCRHSEIAFIQRVAPWFTIEEIHCVIAAHHEALMDLDIDRLMCFMPPRTGKSAMGSIFLPAMWAGRYPSDQILQIGHSVELSRKFSMDVRSIMRSQNYSWIFPGVSLAADAQALGRWRVEDTMSAMEELEKSGEYNAAGVTSSIAGKGFHLGILDDAQSEQDKDSKVVKDRLKNWWGPGFYTRRMPERNAMMINATRWGTDDLPGHLLEQQKKHEAMSHERHHGADVWTVLNVPAILDRDSAKRIYTIAKEYGEDWDPIPDLIELKEGDSFAPRRWTVKELMRSKFNMTDREWNALYMQNPTVDEGHILKRKYWRLWPKDKPPVCVFTFTMYDTAFTEDEANDKSARTTWGVFEHKEVEGERATLHMILLEAWDDHVDAPELKREVLIGQWGGKEAKAALKEMNPQDEDLWKDIDVTVPGLNADRILIENKASGIWLIKELRRIRKPHPMPVWPWASPRNSRGKEMDKFSRAHMGSLVMEQGAVWYMNRKWAQSVIDKCAACQFLGNDTDADLADTVTASMIYVRQTYRVELGSDIDEEEEKRAATRPVKKQYYGARAG